MNDGDDGVLIVEDKYRALVLGKFKQYFLQFGFTMKLEGIAEEMEQVEFCQARPIEVSKGMWRFVRDPTICLSKDSLTLKRCVDVDQLSSLRNAIGWCGAALAGDVPIFCEFYKKMICGKFEETEILSGMQMLAKRMEPRFSQPSVEARVSFWRAYGITPDAQVALEDEIQSTPCPIVTPTPYDITTYITDIQLLTQSN